MTRECRRLLAENACLRRELHARYDLSAIVGVSRAARGLRDAAREAAIADSAVLICGESGAGKELVARTIHHNSSRAGWPFVKVHCAMVPQWLEKELFGEEDARAGFKARVDVAVGGTLFLDEIDRLNERMQARLLRLLPGDDNERFGEGASTGRPRVVAATGRDLGAAITDGSLRGDLYRQLRACVMCIPPLRERKRDIPLLADHFLERFAREHGQPAARLSTVAADAIMNYSWPGNVGELEEALDRALLACEGQVIFIRHLPSTLHPADVSGRPMGASLAAAMDAYEKELIQDALKTARGNRAKAARLLGTTERIMNYRIQKLAIDYRKFRPVRSASVPFSVRTRAMRSVPGAAEARHQVDGLV